jgi:hypothetical protein
VKDEDATELDIQTTKWKSGISGKYEGNKTTIGKWTSC